MVAANRCRRPLAILGGLLCAIVGLSVVFVGSADAKPTNSMRTDSIAALRAPGNSAALTASSPVTSTPSTTFAPLDHLPITPTTDPLITKAQSGHVSDLFVVLCLAGFGAALVLVIAQLFLTRRPRRRRGARTL